MEGKWKFWYHNGKTELEGIFDSGKPMGTIKVWHDNGILKEEVKL